MNRATRRLRRAIFRIPLVAILTAVPALASAPAVPAAPAVDPLLLEARSLLADDRLLDIARTADTQLQPLLADLAKADLARLSRLTALRQFGVLFGRLDRIEARDREVLAWLLSGASTDRLFQTFCLAIGPADSPDTALGVLSRIRQDHGDRPARFAELTTALAVVYDAGPDMSGEAARAPDPASASRLFAFYTNARPRLQIDPVALPWQLGVFVVHNEVTEADLVWALGRFANRQKLRDLYFDVPEVDDAGNARQNRRRNAGQTRLEQLASTGGTTRDRALYAVSIARALGVPATVLYDSGRDGRVRAWVAVLELRDGTLFFDTHPDTFSDFKGLSGQTLDPQTHRVISEAELALLVRFRGVPEEDRLASLALTRLAAARQPGNDAEYLVGRLPTGETDHPRRLDLLLRAIDLAPANRDAWAAIRALGRAGQMDPVGLARVLTAIERHLAPRFPGFALEVLVDAVSWRGTREQIAALDRARSMVRGSPVALMRLQLVVGDRFADDGQIREALARYGTLLDAANDTGALAVEAMARVDRLLREQNDLTSLVRTYRRVWTRMPIPGAAGLAESTAWFEIGNAYVAVLEETGQSAEARQVRQRLATLRSEADVRRGRRP